ncbi:MAG: beta-glucosidase [Cyclobacteriaceae bacterium]|jgi:beta-glucosidase
MKRIYQIILVALMLSSCMTSTNQTANQSDSITQRVDSLLALMTIEEKVGQLNLYNGTWDFTGPVPADNNVQQKAENIRAGKVGAMLNVLTTAAIREAQEMAVENSRLGIPLLFGYDVVHGYRTMLPIPLAQASSWDANVALEGNKVAARESAAAGLNWVFSPMIDVSRDGRWGRIMESAGEDPFLSSIMAEAWIKGLQGDSLSDIETVAACAKHFAAYGYAEAGREYNSADISLQTLYNVVLPPFKAAVDAGAASFMNGFNDLSGVPVTASSLLQRDILKGQWGFKGFVVSDYNSIYELITHGYSPDSVTAALDAVTAGSDMDMESRIYENHLKTLIEEGKVPMSMLDDAAGRILRVKFQLGLFEDPYRYCNAEREKSTMLSDEHFTVARDAARKSIVLLKNEGNLLPLKPSQKIAVIGELASSNDIPLGSWRARATPNSAVSMLDGIEAATDASVSFAQGYQLTEGDRSFIYELNMAKPSTKGFAKARGIAAKADVVVLALGEDCFQSGEGRSQVDTGLKGNQEQLLKELLTVNPNVVVVLMNGRPLAIPEVLKNAPAVVEAWFGGSQAGHAIADVLYGAYNPSGKLPVSFPHHVGQEPIYYSHKNTGRPERNEMDKGLVFWSHYIDGPSDPLLPFGFGLSYSTFSYNGLAVVANQGGASVSIKVTNDSDISGRETVQLYIRDVYARETQPVKRLVDFIQVDIDGRQSVTVEFDLTEEQLGYFHTPAGDFYAEDGLFHIMVGGNSRDLMNQAVEVSF